MTIVLTLSIGLLLETIGSSTSVFAQANQTDGTNITSSADTTSDNATTEERFENITHGGGPGAGATGQSER
ncbi:MAG: hypothetical protein M3M84_00395 [Thermoproteota archaeon]|nr:hypothetical protein [Thermoproteota archaeon]